MTPSNLLNHTSNMTLAQLCQLNSDLVALIKHRQKMEAKDMRQQLSPGDTVSFTERSGLTSTGTVKKIMRTKAVVTIGGRDWKVPMSMLSFA